MQQLKKRQEERLMDNVTVSAKAVEASYILVELTAKQKMLHTIGETLIVPVKEWQVSRLVKIQQPRYLNFSCLLIY